MLLVKTAVKSSKIQGIGLFADEPIGKGTVVWKFDPLIDLYFDVAEVQSLPELQKEFVQKYAVLSIQSGKYVLSIDNARFTNHSTVNHNLDLVAAPGEPELRSVARRDIKVGEELLVDYRGMDKDDANSQEAYLNN